METRNGTRKYKNKRRGTIKKHITQLKEFYPSCKFDQGDNKIIYKDNMITYGEMEYEGIEKLYKIYNKITTFIDIGCGRGKLCFYMANYPKIKSSIGIELVEERYKDAIELKNKLPEYANKVKLINDDMFNVDFTQFGPNIFIWFSNLCFEPSISKRMFDKLSKEIPNSTIACSKEVDGFNNIRNMVVPMSWNKESTIYIYKL